MTTKTTITLITGANRGLGFEVAKILVRSLDQHVLLGSRDHSQGQQAVTAIQASPGTKGTVSAIQIDVEDDSSVDAAASFISTQYRRLDVIINNAATCPESSFAGLNETAPSSRQVLRSVLSTNVTGALSITEAVLPLLRKSSSPRLIFVSSSTASFAHTSDTNSPLHGVGRTEYRMSKAALNFLMLQYHIALTQQGFGVFAADPGLNATGLTGDVGSLRARGAREPTVGGEIIASVARGERGGSAGRVTGDYGDGVVCPW